MLVMTSRSHREPLAPLTLPSRPLRGDELRVRVRSIGVNPVDWKMREGGPIRLAYAFLGPRGPFVTGIDFAGEVIEVGPAGGALAVGVRVVGGTNFSRGQRGSYADEVIARPDQVVELPPSVSFDAAACLPVAAVTPWICLTEHRRGRPLSRVLVLGASGGVGLFGIQIARMLGATAVGVCSARNVALVERLGATAIDYGKGDPLEAARALGPYDVILHAVGTATYPLGRCRSLLAPGGYVDLIVVRPLDYLAVAFLPSVKTVLGAPTRARLTPLLDGLASGKLEAIIEERFPLAEAERAQERSRAGKVVGKLLLTP
jgi:NADPH:quinone reductase-like Zn-dependent oxidoreductase